MSEWKKVKLKECIEEVNERTTQNNQYEVLTSSKTGIYSQEEYFDKQVASKNNVGYKIIKKGQFTYRSMSDNGTFTINRLENKDVGIVSPAYPVFKTINIDDEYLKYYFKSEEFKKAIYNLSQGSTRTALKFKDLVEIEHLLPPIEEQKKIVKVLKHVDSIIEKYESLLKNKEQFIKSQFVEMFENDQYEEKTLDDISIIRGEYGSNVPAMEYDETLPRYVRITDITDSGKLASNSLASPKDEVNIEKYILKYGDILFARTGATVGKTYLYDKLDGECIYAGYCIRFRLNKDIVNPEYIFRYTQTTKYLKWVDIVKRGGAQPNINSKQYGSITIPIPPMELQNQFANIVEQIDKQKFELEKIIENYKKLKKGLMQQLLTGKVKVNV